MAKAQETPTHKYEAVIILHPDVAEAEQKNFFKRNQQTIKQFSGDVNHIDTWGKRRLANPINKMRLGNYFHTTFEAKGDCVAELERLMKIDDRVLRYLHLRLDDRENLSKHVELFHNALADARKREQEKEAKNAARKMGFGGRDGGRDRDGGGYGGRDGGRDGGPGARGPREVSYSRRPEAEGDDQGGGEDSGEEG